MPNSKTVFTLFAGIIIIAGIVIYLFSGHLENSENSNDANSSLTITGDDHDEKNGDALTTESKSDIAIVAQDAIVAQEEKASPTANWLMPTFDILRVEPDGSVVIAGRGEPNTRLEIIGGNIVGGNDVLAETKISSSGDFVVVFETPLPPGSYQFSLRIQDENGVSLTSEELAIVSVPEGLNTDVLAMVQKPGGASRILERPKAGEAEIATLTNDQSTEDVSLKPEDLSQSDKPDEIAAVNTDAEEKTDVKNPGEDKPASAMPSAEERAESTRSENLPVNVRIEAVEVEGSKLFVAGSASAGYQVRVFANDEELGVSGIGADARFIVEGHIELDIGQHLITAALEDKITKKVMLRAIVPFNRLKGEILAATALNKGETVAPDNGAGNKTRRLAKAEEVQAPEGTSEAKTIVQDELQATSRPSVIIRRGDTLWQIARRTYGAGVRYTTIYLANQPQIENPDKIFPGQIFSVPDQALDNAEELHRQRLGLK